jgi:hypothetical protein
MLSDATLAGSEAMRVKLKRVTLLEGRLRVSGLKGVRFADDPAISPCPRAFRNMDRGRRRLLVRNKP